MQIAVCIKQVPDTETKIKLNTDSSGIDPAGIKWIVSPFDEFAIEEALRLKEKNAGAQVTVYTVGPARVVEALRTALAMGADNAVHVDAPEAADSTQVAKGLAAAIQKDATNPQFILFGKEAIDDGAAQVAQMTSVFLGLPSATVVLSLETNGNTSKCRREVEGGTVEVIELSNPCVVAAQKGLNEPRYASLPNIMKAKKKEVKTYKLADLGVAESELKIKYKNFQLPPPKQAGRKIEGDVAAQSAALVKALREEAKVV